MKHIDGQWFVGFNGTNIVDMLCVLKQLKTFICLNIYIDETHE